jgi:hypothetical protein
MKADSGNPVRFGFYVDDEKASISMRFLGLTLFLN